MINLSSTYVFALTALSPRVVTASERKPLSMIAGDIAIFYQEAIQIKAYDGVCTIQVANTIVSIQKRETEDCPKIIGNITTKTSDDN